MFLLLTCFELSPVTTAAASTGPCGTYRCAASKISKTVPANSEPNGSAIVSAAAGAAGCFGAAERTSQSIACSDGSAATGSRAFLESHFLLFP